MNMPLNTNSNQQFRAVPPPSVNMFLKRAYESMLAEKEMKRKDHTKLRSHCQDAIRELDRLSKTINLTNKTSPGALSLPNPTPLPPLKSECVLDESNLLLNSILLQPLIGACECRNSPKITITTLDCLQKLIAYGHVTNFMMYNNLSIDKSSVHGSESESPSNGKDSSVRLIEYLVDIICQTFQSDSTDEGVMLQIVKALLTVMTSSVVEVHEKYVMNIFKTCYNVFMASKNPVNQLTARATLTQMLNVIFQRMENVCMEEAVNAEEALKKSRQYTAVVRDNKNNTDVESSSPEEDDDKKSIQTEEQQYNEQEDSASAVAKYILEEILNKVMEEECEEVNNVNNTKSSSTIIATGTTPSIARCFAHVSQKDAFLVFRSICRLSMKAVPDGPHLDVRSHDYRSKILSLELLLSILQNPGPMFKESDVFIDAIRQYLCIALPKNGGSSSTEVFELTLLIFLSLLTHFKQHLKAQIEVFFKEIFLYILETPTSSFEHKLLVTESLGRICLDAQCVFDLYINYDCDMASANIFEKLVHDLAKVAQGRQAIELGSPTSVQDKNRLRIRGLECLVFVLKCMVEWSRDLYHIPEQQANLISDRASITLRSPASGLQPQPTSGNISRSNSQSSLPNASDNPAQFETLKQRKEFLEKDIQLFNKKPNKGLQALQNHGFVGETPKEVACFLMQDDPRFDLTVVGEFLGDTADFNRKVMYAYIDNLDFSNLDFVSALRLFLSGFRLPGEAQKIDRLMEKFASRYVECNPSNGIFTSADTAYVLAFSIIMLTTSLHSAQLKKHNRMSKEEYIRMNKGINDSEDLPGDYLAAIFDEIASRELKMKETASATASSRLHRSNATAVASGGSGVGIATSEKQRKLLFNMEMESMVQTAKVLMESVSHRKSDFTSATHVEHVRPMFKIVWTPFLAAFSVGLQDCDDPEVSKLCLEGIRCAIRIACIFHMELERDAYVQALARFTMLNAMSSATTSANEIKSKHIDCIKTMISVAHTDGNYLGHSWLEVFRCFSQLESAQLIGQDASPRMISGLFGNLPNSQSGHGREKIISSFGSHASITASSKHAASHLTSSSANHDDYHNHDVTPVHYTQLRVSQEQQQRKLAVIQEVMGETGSQSLVVAVDKIFASSSKLDGNAIVEFVKALCQVSREELSCSPPRIFSLQKLVEISYYNMGRVRLQWSRIWTHIGQHFYSAGRSSNDDVAIFAVDSLRQLSVKFIEKGEFPNFHFQKDFLRPFVSILEECSNVKIQDMIIRCVSQMVQSHWNNIRSGWTNIFTVFVLVASLSDASIVEMAFQTCAFVVNDVLETHFSIVVDSFQGLVKALAEFACNSHFSDISMEAIRFIRTCARYVHEQAHAFTQREILVNPDSVNMSSAFLNFPSSVPATAADVPSIASGVATTANIISLSDEDRVWLKGWMPVLCELFRVINSCKLDVRTRSLTVFFEILKTYGAQFTERWWHETFNVVFRVFLHMRANDRRSYVRNDISSSAGDMSSKSNSTTTAVKQQELLPGSQHETLLPTSPLHALQNLGHPLHADRSEWLTTTCNHTLYAVVDVFTQYYEPLHRVLLDDLYSQLRWCCLQEHEQLARSGTSCLETLVLCNGHLFSMDIWEKTCGLLMDLFEASVPHELLTWKPDMPIVNKPASSNIYPQQQPDGTFSNLLIKCVVQYELIQAVDNILFYPAASRKEDQSNLKLSHFLSTQSLEKLNQLNSEQQENNKVDEWLIHEIEQASKTGNLLDEDLRFISPEWISDRIVGYKGRNSHVNSFSSTINESSDGSHHVADLGVDSIQKPTSVSINNDINPREGMFSQLTIEQLHHLAQRLIQSHCFAKNFNCNHEQRNLLWRAGCLNMKRSCFLYTTRLESDIDSFKGKAKPNLLKQETHSLSCGLRIYFRLVNDARLASRLDLLEKIENELLAVCGDALSYYRHELTVDSHREAWTSVIVLLLSRLLYLLPLDRAMCHLRTHFLRLCDLTQMTSSVPDEVRALLSRCLLRCGMLNNWIATTSSTPTGSFARS